DPDSSYSVDNLPPGPPNSVASNYSGGVMHIHWGVSPEADFAFYHVYRGSSAGFVPGSGNLISVQTDTGFVDSGPAVSFYKLSALDAHGNESAFVTITPTGTSSVPGPVFPTEIVLERVAPNPLIAGGTFHYSIPHDAATSLTIFAADGRRVREL